MTQQVAEAQVKLSLEDRITAPVKRIKAQFAGLAKSLRLDAVHRSARQMMTSLKGVGDGLKAATGRLAGLAAAAGLGGGGLSAIVFGLSKQTAQMGDGLNKASKQLGIGVVNLQLWRYAAEKSGIEAGRMDQALASLGQRSSEAARGNRESAATFRALGVSLRDSDGRLKNTNQLMQDVTQRMGAIKNQAKKEKLASLLFGGDGKDMAAMMHKGMEPINGLFAQARKGGWLIGSDVAEVGSKFTANLDSLFERLKGFKTFLAVQLMPVVNDIIVAFRDWLDENKADIIRKLTEWCKKFHRVIADLKNPSSDLRKKIDQIKESFMAWYARLQPLVDLVGGPLNTVMIVLGAYLGGPLAASLLNATLATLKLSLVLGGALVQGMALAGRAIIGLGIAIMTTPIGWIIAGITAVAGAVYLIYKNWDEFCAYWTGIWDRVTSAFDQGFIQGVLAVLYEFNPGLIIMDAINGIIKWLFGIDLKAAGMAFIGSFYDGLKEKWNGVATWLEGAVNKLTRFLPGWMKEKLGLNIGIDKSATAPARAAREVIEKTAAITRNVTENPVIRHQLPTPAKTATEKVEAGMMQATRVEVQKLALPEPLLVHKPAQIDASVTIQHLTIQNPNGTPEEIRRAVNSALARHAADQRAALASSLSD